MLDEIAVPFFRLFGKFIAYLLVELFFHLFCYFIGRTFLRVVTLGQYRKWIKTRGDGDLEAFVGLMLLFALVIYLVV
ncbi:MAG: hypothetical protein QNJ22_18715 [Desulfosarcinaceae bacterium]|nr:hypothetical protein [Desulfosarcinaceae bacterium]